MNALRFDDRVLALGAMRDMIDRFGLRVSLGALLRAAFAGAGSRLRVLHADDLPDHLRADIGLPPVSALKGFPQRQRDPRAPWML
jgi:hypothetical protein